MYVLTLVQGKMIHAVLNSGAGDKMCLATSTETDFNPMNFNMKINYACNIRVNGLKGEL